MKMMRRRNQDNGDTDIIETEEDSNIAVEENFIEEVSEESIRDGSNDASYQDEFLDLHNKKQEKEKIIKKKKNAYSSFREEDKIKKIINNDDHILTRVDIPNIELAAQTIDQMVAKNHGKNLEISKEREAFIEQARSYENTIVLDNSRLKGIADASFQYKYGLLGVDEILKNPNVTDIHINSYNSCWITEKNGKREHFNIPFAKDAESFYKLCQQWTERYGNSSHALTSSTPYADATAPSGARIHIMSKPLAGEKYRTAVTIRKPSDEFLNFKKLESGDFFANEVGEFIKALVKCKYSIIVSGGTGSGKTTLLRALVDLIDINERVIVCEDTRELGIEKIRGKNSNTLELISNPPNAQGEGEITLQYLVQEILRMDPDRIIVGEVRRGEALDMLLAMSQGNDGGMCTVHADSANTTLLRLATYAGFAVNSPPPDILNQIIQNAIDFIIFVKKIDGSERKIFEIKEVSKNQTQQGGIITTKDIVRYSPEENKWHLAANVENQEWQKKLSSIAGWKGFFGE